MLPFLILKPMSVSILNGDLSWPAFYKFLFSIQKEQIVNAPDPIILQNYFLM